MKIYCDSIAVFEEPEHHGLQRLLSRVRLGHHTLILDDLEGFYASRFFALAVAPADYMEVRELLDRQEPALGDRSLDPGRRDSGPRAELVPVALSVYVCRRDGQFPAWQVDPSNVGDWCEAPLRVLLENDADWQLVACAARVYQKPDVIWLRSALASQAIPMDAWAALKEGNRLKFLRLREREMASAIDRLLLDRLGPA